MKLDFTLEDPSTTTALKHFLLVAIEQQLNYSTIIDRFSSDQDFSDMYGYTKQDLEKALSALNKAIK